MEGFILLIISFFVIPHNLMLGSILFAISLWYFSMRILNPNNLRYREERLKRFYRNHKPRLSLQNNNVMLRMVVKKPQTIMYCINLNTWTGFKIGGTSEQAIAKASTVWGFVDMDFHENMTYSDILHLYNEVYYQDYDRYFSNNIPQFKYITKDNYIVNLKNDESNEEYILCTELCNVKNKKKKRKSKNKTGRGFVIKADKKCLISALYEIRYLDYTFEDAYVYFARQEKYEVKPVTLKQYGSNKNENNKQKRNGKTRKSQNKKINIVNINNCSEGVLSALPGINIILAKRIIKRRIEIDGFKTKEEFYNFCNLKTHFVEQLDKIIKIEIIDNEEDSVHSEERVLDFEVCELEEIADNDDDDFEYVDYLRDDNGRIVDI